MALAHGKLVLEAMPPLNRPVAPSSCSSRVLWHRWPLRHVALVLSLCDGDFSDYHPADSWRRCPAMVHCSNLQSRSAVKNLLWKKGKHRLSIWSTVPTQISSVNIADVAFFYFSSFDVVNLTETGLLGRCSWGSLLRCSPTLFSK